MTSHRPIASPITNPTENSSDELQEHVKDAFLRKQKLSLCGSGSKKFYGESLDNSDRKALDLTGLNGIVDYQPTELVITAGAGTPLATIQQALADQGQMLVFEPPAFGENATLGGCIASGLSGPRRPYAGAVRDSVLGIRIINGQGEWLRFGGQVMKNVAGYDVSRLLVGSLGCLGIITEVSLKVLPLPETEQTWCQSMDAQAALDWFSELRGKPWPVSATAWSNGRAWWRLSGSEAAIKHAAKSLGGELLHGGESFWHDLKEQRLEGFEQASTLWRIALPPATPMKLLENFGQPDWMEWGGAVRWLRSDTEISEPLREQVARHQGHACKFRHSEGDRSVFHPLSPTLASLHKRLKQSFDPAGILNPGRMYPAF